MNRFAALVVVAVAILVARPARAGYPFAYPVGPCGGDTGGTYPNCTVTGIQGHPITLATGYLEWTGTAWVFATPSGGFSVTGTGLPYVVAGVLQAAAVGVNGDVTAGALSGGNIPLTLAAVNANVGTFGSATTVASFTVNAKGLITGASGLTIALPLSQLTQSGAVTGNRISWNGTAWVPSALNLAGGAGYITGLLPAANMGTITLTSDVTGAGSGGTVATTVEAISGTTPIFVSPNEFRWAVSDSPLLSETAPVGGSGSNFRIAPQAAFSSGTSGSLEVDVAAPGSGPTEAGIKLVRAGTTIGQISAFPSAPSYGALYLGSGAEITLESDGATATTMSFPSSGTFGLYSVGLSGYVATFTQTATTLLEPLTLSNLAGSGTRYVTASSTGLLGASALTLGGTPSPSGTGIAGVSSGAWSSSAIAGTTAGQALLWQASGLPAFETVSGDCTITGPGVITCSKINGTSVPAGGSLTLGNQLIVTGSSSASWAALNLAGGSGYVSGDLPLANMTAPTGTGLATTTSGSWNAASLASTTGGQMLLAQSSGLPAYETMSGACTLTAGGVISCGTLAITWANDLVNSTTTHQYVAAISGNGGSGGNLPVSINSMTWAASAGVPDLLQTAAASGAGNNFKIAPQPATSTGASGSLEVDLSAPASGTTEANLLVKRGSSSLAWLGANPGATTFGALYLGTYTAGSPAIESDGSTATYVTFPSSGGFYVYSAGAATNVASFNQGSTTILEPTTLSNLAGTGTRYVTASSTGLLGSTTLTLAGIPAPTGTGVGLVSGGAWAAAAGTVNLASSTYVSGITGVANGGTGLGTLTQYGLLAGNGTGSVDLIAPGLSSYPLVSNGTSAYPTYQQLSLTGSWYIGTLPVNSGGTGTNTLTATAPLIGNGTSAVASAGTPTTSGQYERWNGSAWVVYTPSWHHTTYYGNVGSGTYTPVTNSIVVKACGCGGGGGGGAGGNNNASFGLTTNGGGGGGGASQLRGANIAVIAGTVITVNPCASRPSGGGGGAPGTTGAPGGGGGAGAGSYLIQSGSQIAYVSGGGGGGGGVAEVSGAAFTSGGPPVQAPSGYPYQTSAPILPIVPGQGGSGGASNTLISVAATDGANEDYTELSTASLTGGSAGATGSSGAYGGGGGGGSGPGLGGAGGAGAATSGVGQPGALGSGSCAGGGGGGAGYSNITSSGTSGGAGAQGLLGYIDIAEYY